MLKPFARLQPSYYEAFRCVGSACEDTCCKGWRVPVDKETYEKYQGCSHAALGPKLRELVTISQKAVNDESYAEIALERGACLFLEGGWCSIQAALGEEMLSKNCATYPRVMYLVDGVLERSLDLSCPEAARLALTNPEPMAFEEQPGEADESRLGSVGIVDTTNAQHPEKPYRYVHELRSLMISLLQNRAYSLPERLLVLGRLCDKLEADGTEDCCGGLRDLSLETASKPTPALIESTQSFETVIELILAGVAHEAPSRRFLDCYQIFMAGLNWTMDSTMEDLAERLEAAYQTPYGRFRREHGYVLENYLVAYVFRNLFPFGSRTVNRRLAEYSFHSSISRQYQLMVAQFAVIETMLAGLAAFYGERFGMAEALKLMQSASKTFEHSVAYPGKALELLAGRGMLDCASMSALIRA